METGYSPVKVVEKLMRCKERYASHKIASYSILRCFMNASLNLAWLISCNSGHMNRFRHAIKPKDKAIYWKHFCFVISIFNMSTVSRQTNFYSAVHAEHRTTNHLSVLSQSLNLILRSTFHFQRRKETAKQRTKKLNIHISWGGVNLLKEWLKACFPQNNKINNKSLCLWV